MEYIIVIILFIATSFMIYAKLNPKKFSSNLIGITGNMDGDLITLNTKYIGHIKKTYHIRLDKI